MRSVRGSTVGWSRLKAKKRKPKKPKFVPHKCYGVTRKATLDLMGYRSYKEYLKGPEWKKARESKLGPGSVCVLCPNKAVQVHHLSYDLLTMMGGDLRLLVQMCRGCHESIEVTPEGKKRTLYQANVELFRRALAIGGKLDGWVWTVLGIPSFRLMRKRFKREIAAKKE